MVKEDNMTVFSKDSIKSNMAESQRPGVIRSTRDYLCPVTSPATTVALDNCDDAPTPSPISTLSGDDLDVSSSFARENPREIRNKAEKQRRDKLNQSIAELAAMVPPVVASSRKIDKTGVLRLTAHYLRAHQYVFGDTINHGGQELKLTTAESILNLLNGFLLTTTYRGIVVAVSQNVHQFLGYKELDLLGQNVFTIVHPGDHRLLREQMTPSSQLLGQNGELLVPDEPNAKKAMEDALTHDQRRFIVRFKKQGQRSEPVQYITCHIEGSFRKSDRARHGYNRCCQVVRRVRARSDNPCSSGNDVVFIGVVRPAMDTFSSETRFESMKMEYRTRHSIDGEIIQCEQRISLVTGYMTNEVSGVNAMNFMHKDDVQWVIMTLRDMYVNKELYGESCYRLMTKNGEFIYMRTRGCLDVDNDSRAVTTFVCTNTVVQEQEGKHFIQLMKNKFRMKCINNENVQQIVGDKIQEAPSDESVLVKDPVQLKKEILELVNDLPSPSRSPDAEPGEPRHSLALVPPRKERIVSAIDKIYTIIKTFPKESSPERQRSSNLNFDLMNQATQTEELTQTSTSKCYPIPEASTRRMSKLTTFEDAFMPRFAQPTATVSSEIINIEEYEKSRAQEKNLQQLLPYVIPNSTVTMVTTNEVPVDGNFQLETKGQYVYNGPRIMPQAPPAITNVANNLEGYRKVNLKRSKRSIDSTDFNAALKRKNTQIEETNVLGIFSPQLSLEKLLDEAILNTEFSTLDTDLESLEQRVDPSFPDLLSNEVQEILGTIEDDPGEDFPSGT